MDKLDPQKYIEEQRAKQQAEQRHGTAPDEDTGSAAGLITIIVVLLSVLGYVASFLLDMREVSDAPPAQERPEMATEFWGPDSEPAPVDTPAGMFTQIFKFPLGMNQAVNCHFVIEETYLHEDWSSTVAIALSELGRFEPEVVGEEYVKITAVLWATDGGRIYKLSTWENEEQYSYPFLGISDPADEIWLVLGSRSGGDFAYRAGEEPGNFGAGLYHRPSISPRVATVIVSGAKGAIDCEVLDI